MRLKNVILSLADWIANIILSVFTLALLWFLAQLLFYASFSIPTDSMMPAIRPGDKVLVDKTMMGARIYNPFAAARGEQVDIYRMPGWRDMKRGDIIVFNFPYAASWDSIAMHPAKYLIKRCLALPGDTISIRDCTYMVNGLPTEYANHNGEQELRSFLQQYSNDQEQLTRMIVLRAFPNDSTIPWTISEFGPMWVPAAGKTLQLTPHTATLYRNYIEWETGRKITIDSLGSVAIDGKQTTEYRFTHDYCFVAGDRVFNSQDSRYFGLLPTPFIVGRATKKIKKG